MMVYIPLAECKHGWRYLLDSRNLRTGVYDQKTRGFTGIRVKFDSVFLFTEYHWDTGVPYGTAKPLQELEDWTHLLPDLEITLLKREYLHLMRELAKLAWHKPE